MMMRLFQFNPTIRETNKYLSKTVDDLQKKHGGVSNEEFERELTTITGIGWKQVKNYKNHPKPSERIKGNAVILKFVLQARARDTGRKVRRLASMLVAVASIGYAVLWFVNRPNRIEQFIIHEFPPAAHRSATVESRLFVTLISKGWLFRLGPLERSQVPIAEFSCMDILGIGGRNCSFQGPTVQATIILDGNIVRGYAVISFDPEDIAELRKQLVELLGAQIIDFPAPDKALDERTLQAGGESVSLLATSVAQGMRPMLSVTVSLQ